MTREEATELLRYRRNLISSVDMDWCANETEALDLALAALRTPTREQVEKVWRGEWKPTEFPYMNECEDCSVCGYRTPWGHGFRFCPACGAAQTDEAVETVMERINEMEGMKK